MPYLYLMIRHLMIALPSERICHHDSSRDYSNFKAKYEKENRLKYLKASWPETRQREKNGSHICRSPITCSYIYPQKRNIYKSYFHDITIKWQGSNFPLKMNNTSVTTPVDGVCHGIIYPMTGIASFILFGRLGRHSTKSRFLYLNLQQK